MLVSNVYRPTVFACRADEPLADVARRMIERKVGALAVLDGDRVAGIITERDLAGALASSPDPAAEEAAGYASARVETAALDEDAGDVARRMLEAGIRHLPVDDHGRLVGMVSMRDLLALETWAA
ncbi:CBS domain-containing protein [Actinomadura coerulea]|uniref:CBS domain-containing protein n=1 Tax=Actinomadura coerulea TaxID=46159 RepID=A0A7X0FUW4_9ACTN|nr:CBS domain-containing protein [Actinomadura coerulea]MBB6394137.1 CBS domain-containing protein [Actinomadura coerulea]GGQ20467.1 signal transduction protein [Actinomadura coerulea]